MKNTKLPFLFALLCTSVLLGSCKQKTVSDKEFASQELNYASEQLGLLRDDAVKNNRIPRTVHDGRVVWCDEANYLDWTEGFFPGTCWYLYQFSNNNQWEKAADQLQKLYEKDQFLTMSHDLGFIFNCSFGNGYRITKNEHYKDVVVQAASSLSKRFNPKVGCIQSWNVSDGSWQSNRGWQFPVIIDNMMNLEMLFTATTLTGDSTYWNMAVKHADRTMKEHFRADNSSFHVVDYDTITGNVRMRETAQGYAHESAWSRGQGWGLYGFTVCYRFTKDPKYLDQAIKIANFILNNPNLPEDLVPYWDFDAPEKEKQPRDVSAAAIIASALIELNSYDKNPVHYDKALQILKSLSSSAYKAKIGENHHFLLMHSVGSIPHKSEIDVPLNYADYYYVEALTRILNYEKK